MEKSVLSGKTVLLVEDDLGIVNLLRKFFVSQGADVTILQSGKDVVKSVEEIHPDIMILDVIVPHVDGFTILDTLRSRGNKTPVIMLTDKSSVSDKVKGLSGGADDYMTKPFSTKELLARVMTVLRRVGEMKNGQNLEKVTAGTLTIIVSAREIHLADGRLLQLTKTEFDLFSFLANKQTEVVPHTTLLKEVLGYKSDVETKALVMHIANIRKKLAKSSQDSVRIETVAGVGYKLMIP